MVTSRISGIFGWIIPFWILSRSPAVLQSTLMPFSHPPGPLSEFTSKQRNIAKLTYSNSSQSLAPRLEFLSLPKCLKEYNEGGPLTGANAVKRAARSPGFSLYELSFSGPFTWLQWTLSSTRNTLTILELHDSLSEDHFEAILSAHGASLLSLRLSNEEDPLSDEASVSLSHCVRLQEFRYLHLPSDATLDHLPLSTLEHLELTLDNRTYDTMSDRLASLADWIAKSKLSIFTWNWLDVLTIWNPWGDISRTRGVCTDSGIELRYFEPPLGAWTGERYA